MLSIRLLKNNCKRREGILRGFYDLLDIRAGLRDGDAISRTFQDVQDITYMLEPSLFKEK